MANESESDQPLNPAHFIVCPAILPKPTDSFEEWAARSVMLADMAEQLAGTLFTWVRINVPMLADPDTLPAQLIAAVGVLMKGVRDSGRVQLQKAGIEPLDAKEDQANMARDRLADPATPADEREFLLGVLAHKLQCEQGGSPREASQEAPEDWPDVLVTGENEAE